MIKAEQTNKVFEKRFVNEKGHTQTHVLQVPLRPKVLILYFSNTLQIGCQVP